MGHVISALLVVCCVSVIPFILTEHYLWASYALMVLFGVDFAAKCFHGGLRGRESDMRKLLGIKFSGGFLFPAPDKESQITNKGSHLHWHKTLL
jgi:hypothetical protein